jgi:hypothetical protein
MLRRVGAQRIVITLMFLGGALVAVRWPGAGRRRVAPPALSAGWLGLAQALSALFTSSNLALQFGAAQLPADAPR